MTLGAGDHVTKLARHYDADTKETTHGPDLTQGEAYHEFEVVESPNDQGNPDGFTAKLRLVK